MDTKVNLTSLPTSPGVYLFKDSRGQILYVGKAIHLSRRVRQYFQKDDGSLGPKIAQLVALITSVQTIKTANEFDALLLEAKLIREHMPKYNSIAKDDKSPLYIGLTLSEELPRVLFLRGKELTIFTAKRDDRIFGPFQSARVARHIMRDMRRSIPFCTQKRRDGRPCFYTHIGLCHPCPSYISKLPEGEAKKQLKGEYRQNMFRLKDILSGSAPAVMKAMEKEMRDLAMKESFEAASHKKKQIEALYASFARKYDISLYTNADEGLGLLGRNARDGLKLALSGILPVNSPLIRIECFDISNTSGTNATGSMVVLTEGTIDPSQYRKFKIRSLSSPNDVGMIEEVLTRRFAHPEWPIPDLLVIDGGKPQLKKAIDVLKALSLSIPVIGLAKRLEEIVIYEEGDFRIIRLPLTHPALHLLQRIRDEAHRFALTYHRKLRGGLLREGR